jgi:cytochrome c55X
LPATLAGKPFDSMVATVLNGRPGSAMPGWSRFMNESEAEWVVRALVEGFPEEQR